jgi:hypothetical protein
MPKAMETMETNVLSTDKTHKLHYLRVPIPEKVRTFLRLEHDSVLEWTIDMQEDCVTIRKAKRKAKHREKAK